MDERDYKALNAELKKDSVSKENLLSVEEKAEKEYPKEFLGGYADVYERAAFVKGYNQAIEEMEGWVKEYGDEYEYIGVSKSDLLTKLQSLKTK